MDIATGTRAVTAHEECAATRRQLRDAQSCVDARLSAGSVEAWAPRPQGQQQCSERVQRPLSGCRRPALRRVGKPARSPLGAGGERAFLSSEKGVRAAQRLPTRVDGAVMVAEGRPAAAPGAFSPLATSAEAKKPPWARGSMICSTAISMLRVSLPPAYPPPACLACLSTAARLHVAVPVLLGDSAPPCWCAADDAYVRTHVASHRTIEPGDVRTGQVCRPL